ISKWKNKQHQMLQVSTEKDIEESIWRARVEGKESDLLKYDELIDYLKSLKDLNNIEVWMDAQKKWKDLFAVNRIVDTLGVSRRSHPRVPIIGNLHCESPAKGNFDVKVITISEGGTGVVEAKSVRIGDRFKGTLDSPNLFSKIVSQFEVLYVGKDGYAGLKFVGLPLEFKTQIIEYVNKFSND
ncbi:MAG TPA: PilZ domain-containing protein, partial [Pseudobdellovibrionaceae bacterium]|nr:PilZ domain-containing protein [Pseudobdellovibrionaceae bacterium]